MSSMLSDVSEYQKQQLEGAYQTSINKIADSLGSLGDRASSLSYAREELVGGARNGHISVPGDFDITPELFKFYILHRGRSAATAPTKPGVIYVTHEQVDLVPLEDAIESKQDSGNRPNRTTRVHMSRVPDGVILLEPRDNRRYQMDVQDGTMTRDPITLEKYQKDELWYSKEAAMQEGNTDYVRQLKIITGDPDDLPMTQLRSGVTTKAALQEHRRKYGTEVWNEVKSSENDLSHKDVVELREKAFNGIPAKSATPAGPGIPAQAGKPAIPAAGVPNPNNPDEIVLDMKGGKQRAVFDANTQEFLGVREKTHAINNGGYSYTTGQNQSDGEFPMFHQSGTKVFFREKDDNGDYKKDAEGNFIIGEKMMLWKSGAVVDPTQERPMFKLKEHKHMTPPLGGGLAKLDPNVRKNSKEEKQFEANFRKEFKWVSLGPKHHKDAWNQWDKKTQESNYQDIKEKWKDVWNDASLNNQQKLDKFHNYVENKYWKADENAQYRLLNYGAFIKNTTKPMRVNEQGKIETVKDGDFIAEHHPSGGQPVHLHGSDAATLSTLGGDLQGGGNRVKYGKWLGHYYFDDMQVDYVKQAFDSKLAKALGYGFKFGEEDMLQQDVYQKSANVIKHEYSRLMRSSGNTDALPADATMITVAKQINQTRLGMNNFLKAGGLLIGSMAAGAGVAGTVLAATTALPAVAVGVAAVGAALAAGQASQWVYQDKKYNTKDFHDYERRANFDTAKIYDERAVQTGFLGLKGLAVDLAVARRGVRALAFFKLETRETVGEVKGIGLGTTILGGIGVAAAIASGAGAAAIVAAASVAAAGAIGTFFAKEAEKGHVHFMADNFTKINQQLDRNNDAYFDATPDQHNRVIGWNPVRDMDMNQQAIFGYARADETLNKRIGINVEAVRKDAEHIASGRNGKDLQALMEQEFERGRTNQLAPTVDYRDSIKAVRESEREAAAGLGA